MLVLTRPNQVNQEYATLKDFQTFLNGPAMKDRYLKHIKTHQKLVLDQYPNLSIHADDRLFTVELALFLKALDIHPRWSHLDVIAIEGRVSEINSLILMLETTEPETNNGMKVKVVHVTYGTYLDTIEQYVENHPEEDEEGGEE